MIDRFLSGVLWLLVMTMISGVGGAALVFGFQGVFSLCAGKIPSGCFALGLGLVLASGAFVLCRHCNDLMDR